MLIPMLFLLFSRQLFFVNVSLGFWPSASWGHGQPLCVVHSGLLPLADHAQCPVLDEPVFYHLYLFNLIFPSTASPRPSRVT